MILKIFSTTISSIIHFSVEQKYCERLSLWTLTNCKERKLFTISYTLVPEKYVIKLCNICILKEIWFVLWYRSASFREIIVMRATKYLNKYNKLWHFAKYLGKSFLMQNNSPKSFFSIQKGSNALLFSYNLKCFFKNATIYNSRNKGVMFMI